MEEGYPGAGRVLLVRKSEGLVFVKSAGESPDQKGFTSQMSESNNGT